MTVEVQCYNKGCNKKYHPEDNADDSCKYHPGGPIFHDALKKWSCCNKKSVDFTEFLNTPGCATGPHSNVKPEKAAPVTEATETAEAVTKEDIIVKAPNPTPPTLAERPPVDEQMTLLTPSVGASLRQALEKMNIRLREEKVAESGADTERSVQPGTHCHNNSCKSVYVDASSDAPTCTFHNGTAVFHEGMKYWSCCERKTTEFSKFMEQEGCTTGPHLWVKKKDPSASASRCRLDWHQTGSTVVISVFAKLADPVQTRVEINRVAAKIQIAYGPGGEGEYSEECILYGIVKPEASVVNLLGTKVEIVLRKAEPDSWPRLVYHHNAKQLV